MIYRSGSKTVLAQIASSALDGEANVCPETDTNHYPIPVASGSRLDFSRAAPPFLGGHRAECRLRRAHETRARFAWASELFPRDRCRLSDGVQETAMVSGNQGSSSSCRAGRCMTMVTLRRSRGSRSGNHVPRSPAGQPIRWSPGAEAEPGGQLSRRQRLPAVGALTDRHDRVEVVASGAVLDGGHINAISRCRPPRNIGGT
jgi:hypothetical protein